MIPQRRGVEAKRKAWRYGVRSELIAAWFLRFKGYRILARGFRTPVGEVDLIARRGRVLVFVEVKARRDVAAAAAAITRGQQQRIARAAGAFIGLHPELAGLDQRYDAIFLIRRKRPVHIEDAWRLNG
ncbi:MAG: YraN family protein [Rhodospirillales bacterium]|nr:YraN family protein [Rhodospirillales bacterium]MCW8862876.1 YraN family protein [Rhodospirillales bacterium]MCW8952364.1 YraN family protein [Rhodospirillales bacterium]MCW8971160.1 YraN family protein [Rhodospirillales bacterium]MCW9003015.1 YraN family protein [Rhodospirillales bacterium]